MSFLPKKNREFVMKVTGLNGFSIDFFDQISLQFSKDIVLTENKTSRLRATDTSLQQSPTSDTSLEWTPSYIGHP